MANTHLGVPPQDLVVLETVGLNPKDLKALTFARINYDTGRLDPMDKELGYTAPEGKALVITEIDWHYEAGKAGQNVTLRIFLNWLSYDPAPFRRVLQSTILLGSNGGGGISTIETTGIVIKRGVKITVDVIGSGATGKIQHVLLRGYLIDV